MREHLTLDKDTEKKLEGLTKKFKTMMLRLSKEKGTEMKISIMESPEVQDFVQGHAKILDSAFSTRKMTDAMRRSLKESDYLFSGMKTFHELKESFPKLIDENGNRKSFERFYNDVRKIDKTYNRNYLKAEYKFAQQSANMAAKWEDFEKKGDRYLLQYRTMNDDRVRETHRALHGVTLPISDSFWDKFMPPNSWGCRCTVVQVRRGKYEETDHDTAMGRGAAATENDKRGMFRFNPGKERKTFPDHNPYTISRCKTCSIAKGKGKLAKVPISDNELCANCQLYRIYIKYNAKQTRLAAKALQGTSLSHPNFKNKINISGKNIKEWTNQPHKHYIEKNKMLLDINRQFAKSEYLGSTKDKKARKNVLQTHVFQIKIKEDDSFILVHEYNNGNFSLHSVSDSQKFKTMAYKKEP